MAVDDFSYGCFPQSIASSMWSVDQSGPQLSGQTSVAYASVRYAAG